MSVLPPTAAERILRPRSQTLQAANGSPITTWGEKLLTIDIGPRRTFNWITDVNRPIIGIDFLSHYGMLIEPAKPCLVDTSSLQATTAVSEVSDLPFVVAFPLSNTD